MNDCEGETDTKNGNMMLEDIISYNKFNELPEWMVPDIDYIDWEASALPSMVNTNLEKLNCSKKPSMKTFKKLNMETKHNVSVLSSKE